MMHKFIFALIFLCASAGVAATPEDILKTAWKDQDLTSYSEAVGILSHAQPNNPFTEFQLTLGSETGRGDEEGFKDGFRDPGKVDNESFKNTYGFRIYPKGWSEFSAYRNYLGALDADERGLKREALSQILVKRYNLLARLAYLKEKNKSSRDLSALSERAGRALAYNAQKDRSELKNYLKAKTELDKIYLKLAELDRDLAIAEQELKSLSLSNAKNIDVSDLLSPEEISQKIATFDENKTSLSAEKARLDYDRSLAALRYDQAQENKWFSYFEFTVKDNLKLDKEDRRNYEKYTSDKVYGIEVGFKLPFLSSPDLSTIDKQARLARAKAESNSDATIANQTLFATVTELKTLLNLHQNLKERQSQNSPAALKRASDLVAKQDPLLAVGLQRGWYESFEQLADIELQIRTLYIQYLHETAVLAQDPETNHLSKSKKRIL